MDGRRWAGVGRREEAAIGRATALRLAAGTAGTFLVHCRRFAGRGGRASPPRFAPRRSRPRWSVAARFGPIPTLASGWPAKPGTGPAALDDLVPQTPARTFLTGAGSRTGRFAGAEAGPTSPRVDLWGTMAGPAGRSANGCGKPRRPGAPSWAMGWDQSATGMAGDSGELFAAIKGRRHPQPFGPFAFAEKSLSPSRLARERRRPWLDPPRPGAPRPRRKDWAGPGDGENRSSAAGARRRTVGPAAVRLPGCPTAAGFVTGAGNWRVNGGAVRD